MTASEGKTVVVIDGESLTPEILVELSKGASWRQIEIAESSRKKVQSARKVVEEVIDRGEVVYGINTGFGKFSNVTISKEQLQQLQRNLILSHAIGVGEPLTRERTRMLLALRINVLCKGHSGVRIETLDQLVSAFNKDCLSVVPQKGTLGASGDLAPLSHVALGLMGLGDMWDPSGTIRPATEVLSDNGLLPLDLQAKEALALINGTQLITALGAECVVRAKNAILNADLAVALSTEALKGTWRSTHPFIHGARPHSGQRESAHTIFSLLSADSEIASSHKDCGAVQDAYTLRCAPQVHGVVRDTVAFVYNILKTEMNSATDNPMIFCEEDTFPLHGKKCVEDGCLPVGTNRHGFIISGGNFHGEYPAKACDYLAIAVAELASMSERRIERLCNPDLSNLAAFLVPNGGLNSGFMIPHCTAAALVSENKVLTHPSSSDSISTSAAKEDHVSMGGFAARKALTVMEHVETVLAIEMIAACQGIDLLQPLKATAAVEKAKAAIRQKVAYLDKDRYLAPELQEAIELVRTGAVWDSVKEFVPPVEYKF